MVPILGRAANRLTDQGPRLPFVLATYAAVLTRPGALAFSATGVFARLPLSMVGIAIVLLVTGSGESYTVAGSLSAACVVANAVFAVPQGRLVDSLGQSRVLAVTALIFGVGVAGLILTVRSTVPLPLVYLCALVSGAAMPQIGSCVRARWSHALDRQEDLDTAFALEAVLDEVVFVVGPALVAGVLGPLALAAQRGTAPPVHPRRDPDGTAPRLTWAVLGPLTVVMTAVGAVFGSVEVVTIAVSQAEGAAQWSGALLATFAGGSLLAGAVTGAISWERAPAQRLTLSAAIMLGLTLPLPFLSSLPLLAGWLFVCGMTASPVLIAAMSLVQQTSPERRLTEAMGVTHAGLAAGVAIGAGLGGAAVDRVDAWPAYVVALAAAGLASGGALVTQRTAR
jgi:MFS family permease